MAQYAFTHWVVTGSQGVTPISMCYAELMPNKKESELNRIIISGYSFQNTVCKISTILCSDISVLN